MGWNSWNSGIALTEQNVKATVDALVASGMRDAGYRYVNLDAGWAASTRDGDGNLRADPDRFPAGIGALARYVHDRGMYLGLYNSPFNEGCGQDPRVGSAGHETADANTFARWGVDYLKYDWCRLAADHADQVARFTAMRDALRASGRRILYSINPNSSGDPGAGTRYDWSDIADLSRNTVDLVPTWGDEALWDQGLAGVRPQFAAAAPLAARSRPGRWNDPDMLVLGIPWATFVTGHPTMALPQAADLTEEEQRSHFSLWAMLAAPLLAGNDITSMTEQTRALLTNREVIDVDQDPLVVQGTASPSDGRVIVKPLVGGSVAVALFNTGDAPGTIAIDTAAAGLPPADCYTVRDLWAHRTTTATRAIERAAIPPHGVAMLKLTPGCR
jgi:alpha-galactosidase